MNPPGARSEVASFASKLNMSRVDSGLTYMESFKNYRDSLHIKTTRWHLEDKGILSIRY